MVIVPIDDDFRVVRRARRYHHAAVVMVGAGACLIVGGIIGSIATRNGWPLILCILGALYAFDGREAKRNTSQTRRLSTTATADVGMGEHGLTVRHPTLPEPLVLPWRSLRAYAVETLPMRPRWRRWHYDLFPIHRAPGSLHPLDEPRWFLSTHGHELGKRPVQLTRVDLAGSLPNVALLFRDRLPVSIAAPLMPIGGEVVPTRSVAGSTLPLARELRLISTPGLYLRVEAHLRLAKALDDAGVRRGFTCEDWSFVTGLPHPSQPSP